MSRGEEVLRALWPARVHNGRTRTSLADWLAVHDLVEAIREIRRAEQAAP